MTKQTNTFGKYEILGELGRGGFATVYRAKDTTLGREVALKLLDPSRTWEPGFVERFYQEARVAAQLKHPNIIVVHEIGEVDGQLFIATELVGGGSLRDRLEQNGALGLAETVALLMPVANALEYAHANGVVHRDVKPANILLDPDPHGGLRPVLTDFGLVKALSHSTELTQSGAILGTVEYMAPEQADSDRRDEIGAATDNYSLSVVAYHTLTGRVPFTGSTIEVLMAHANKQPPSPIELRPDLSPAISDAILKALAKQPENRYPTATGFVQALGSGEPTDQIAEIPTVLAPPPEPVPTEFDDAEDVPTPTVREKEQKDEKKSKGRSWWWWLVIPIILIAVIFAIVVFGTDTFHPAILELSYSPKNPAPGEDITIVWRTKYAQRINIWPLGYEFTASDGNGEVENGVSGNIDLTVVASNLLGDDAHALPIEVAVDKATDQPIICDNASEEIGGIGLDDCLRTMELATQFINAGCTDPDLWVNRGHCYDYFGDNDAALVDFTVAIALDPSEPWHYIDRSEIHRQMGEPELRQADLNKAVSVAPDDPQTHFHRADYYKDQENYQAAIDDITQALDLDTTEPEYYFGRGQVYRQMGDIEAAIADFEKFMELSVGFKVYDEQRAEVEVWLEEYRTTTPTQTPQSNSKPDADHPVDIALAGDYAYMSVGSSGLWVVDVKDPTNFGAVGALYTPGFVYSVAGAGDYVYVADGDSGLKVVDVNDARKPREVGALDTPGNATDVVVAGDYAYMADDGLRVVDVSDPTNPREVGASDTPGNAYHLALAEDYAYVADGKDGGLRVVDVSDPTNPREVGAFDTPGTAYRVAVAGDYAYVADYEEGLRVVDVSDPTNPREVGAFDTSGDARDVIVTRGYAYLADGGSGLRVVDVNDPTNPYEMASLDTPGYAYGLTVSEDYAYLATGPQGLLVVDVSDAANPRAVEIDGMKMVYVPAGEFTMGSEKGEGEKVGGYYRETPQRNVYVDAFWIDQTEVTNEMFSRFVEDTNWITEAERNGEGRVGSLAKIDEWEFVQDANWRQPRGPGSSIEGKDDHPVVQVSWNDAVAYCKWAGRRLPTEAEWEKAARGEKGHQYPWGDDPVAGHLVNFADRSSGAQWAEKKINDGYETTAPVGSYPNGSSPNDALDMAGNVQEWVSDWYDARYYQTSPEVNPTGPSSGESRVVRNGSWRHPASKLHAARRTQAKPEHSLDYVGFRCASTPSLRGK